MSNYLGNVYTFALPPPLCSVNVLTFSAVHGANCMRAQHMYIYLEPLHELFQMIVLEIIGYLCVNILEDYEA
jgi:uncharacterized integral membrane protein